MNAAGLDTVTRGVITHVHTIILYFIGEKKEKDEMYENITNYLRHIKWNPVVSSLGNF